MEQISGIRSVWYPAGYQIQYMTRIFCGKISRSWCISNGSIRNLIPTISKIIDLKMFTTCKNHDVKSCLINRKTIVPVTKNINVAKYLDQYPGLKTIIGSCSPPYGSYIRW